MKKLASSLACLSPAIAAFLCCASILGGSTSAHAQVAVSLSTVYTFDGLAISAYQQTVTPGSDGNFYGVTNAGGANGTGEVFRLSSDGTLTDLHDFAAQIGADPSYSPLVQGIDGNFYGVSYSDGAQANDAGTIYGITPAGFYKVLHVFGDTDGYVQAVALAQDGSGNFYGVTDGGANDCGEVYKLTPDGVFSVLHNFNGDDGFSPEEGMVLGSDGNLYGTTSGAFDQSQGTIFVVSPAGAFTDLYHFGPNDGEYPNATLVQGADGNFYGTTGTASLADGTEDYGTLFKVTPAGMFTVLHTFTGGLDGSGTSGLTLGTDGNLYGATMFGGLYGHVIDVTARMPGYGTLYQITPTGIFTTLYNFTGAADGRNPAGPLAASAGGAFYGTTGGDGAAIAGNLYQARTVSHPSFFAGQESIGNGLYYLEFPIGNYFGYYGFLGNPNYLYHFDLGYECVYDADDGREGIYLYDFASSTFFYTNPAFPFPYLYDFTSQSVLYYYPDPNNAGHYTTNPRYFYNFATGQVITK